MEVYIPGLVWQDAGIIILFCTCQQSFYTTLRRLQSRKYSQVTNYYVQRTIKLQHLDTIPRTLYCVYLLDITAYPTARRYILRTYPKYTYLQSSKPSMVSLQQAVQSPAKKKMQKITPKVPGRFAIASLVGLHLRGCFCPDLLLPNLSHSSLPCYVLPQPRNRLSIIIIIFPLLRSSPCCPSLIGPSSIICIVVIVYHFVHRLATSSNQPNPANHRSREALSPQLPPRSPLLSHSLASHPNANGLSPPLLESLSLCARIIILQMPL